MKFSKLVLASGNQGKLRELEQLLAPLNIELISQKQLGIADAAEPFSTFVENALQKARHASRASGLPALADDSGVCCLALHGAPGVHSARYSVEDEACVTAVSREQTDAANNKKLISVLSGLPDKTAFYYCVLVLVKSPDDPAPMIADGHWYGEMVSVPQGQGGFGYDPYFFLPQLQLTAAQISIDQKNRISHRAQAMGKLIDLLKHQQQEVARQP